MCTAVLNPLYLRENWHGLASHVELVNTFSLQLHNLTFFLQELETELSINNTIEADLILTIAPVLIRSR